MTESLLDAARREVLLDWSEAGVPDLVNARVGDTWAKVGRIPLTDLFVATLNRSTSPSVTMPDAFAWLRAQLKAQRDACDRALGGGWRMAKDGLPREHLDVLLFDKEVRLVASLVGGEWYNATTDEYTYVQDTDLWHPLPELPEVKP